MGLKMYYLNSQLCKTIDEFINCYNSQYYWMNNGNISENIIDNLLKQEAPYEKEEIFYMLAWKIGKISTNEGTKEGFVYHKGWNKSKLIIKIYDKEIDVKNLLKKVEKESQKQYKIWGKSEFLDNKHEAAKILETLAMLQTPQIGPVYLITLLYFLTKGRWPIYDKYTYIALKEITGKGENKPFSVKAEYHEHLPYKIKTNPQDFPAKMKGIISGKNQYTEYIKMLKEFEDAYAKEKGTDHDRSYIKSRDIDRALWAYGHCFK